MPPVFALPPAIQKISVKLASARAAASALVALESLTNSTCPLRPTCSMRCARPGKLSSPDWISPSSSPTLRLAAQRTDPFEEADALVAAVLGLHQVGAVGEVAVGQRQPLGDADHVLAGAL